jgi:hypothetical protein
MGGYAEYIYLNVSNKTFIFITLKASEDDIQACMFVRHLQTIGFSNFAGEFRQDLRICLRRDFAHGIFKTGAFVRAL